MTEQSQHDTHGHPSTKTYVLIAAVLTVVTAIEFGALYVPALSSVLVPMLLLLSAAKFAMVVGYYMHLKPDPPLFRVIFLFPLFLAAAVMLGLMALFSYHTPIGG